MLAIPNYINSNHLDSYSMLIVSKYFVGIDDYINVMCVCKKFKKTTKKLRYNPIHVTSFKLFPKIQTQYLYNDGDQKIKDKVKYEIWYNVDYKQYLDYKNDGVKCHYVKYTKDNRIQYGDGIPNDVTMLNKICFHYSNPKSITISTKITLIGNDCFNCCYKLSSIILPTNLTIIDHNCFYSCIALSTIKIPPLVQSIGSGCFSLCKNLQTIIIHDSITSIGRDCFDNCYSLKTITLPSSISTLESGVFNACQSLSKIVLPTSLVLIGNCCFQNCSSLTTLKLPTSLKQIGKECFKMCGIKSIEIPDSVDSIGFDCFSKCSSLTNLQIQPKNKEFKFKVSRDDLILYKKFNITCNNNMLINTDVTNQIIEMKKQGITMSEFIIPDGVVKICHFAFFNKDIKSIIIPTTVTSIGNYCFSNCRSLTSISIPSSVKSIGNTCFCGSDNLKQLSVPLNENNKYPFKVTYGDYLTLKQCNVDCEYVIFDEDDYYEFDTTIPKDIPIIVNICINGGINEKMVSDNVISLKSNHLSKDITSITISTSLTYLCNSCFENYLKLQTVMLPTTLKYIGKHLIDGCTSLTELKYEGDWKNIVVSYNDHLRYKSIGLIFNSIEYTNYDKIKFGNIAPSIIHSLHNSYYDRTSKAIHIPTHITSLDNNMFESFSKWNPNYSKLQTISIPTSISIIPKYCFNKCYLLTYISLPSSLKSIKKKAFANCISIQSINIPTSVTKIKEFVFKNCYSLTSLTLPKTVQLGTDCFKRCDRLKRNFSISPHYL
ncbi:hypothetical protein QTN25_003254 [Entamoeba marina]